MQLDELQGMEGPTYPWTEKVETMSPMLQAIWREVTEGDRKTDLKALLDLIPRYNELPKAPLPNNHAQDAKRHADQRDRNIQQKLLHVLRVLAHCDKVMEEETPTDNIDAEALYYQGFQLIAELYMSIERDRKIRSVPGSVPQEGLFNKDELQNAP